MDNRKLKGHKLFNATAMKEALSSGQLNHYVLVFTIATVIFLPLSFVTVCHLHIIPTFWA